MSPGVPRGVKKGAEQFDWFIILSVQHIELFSKAKKEGYLLHFIAACWIYEERISLIRTLFLKSNYAPDITFLNKILVFGSNQILYRL